MGRRKTTKLTWFFAVLVIVFIVGDLSALLLPAWKAAQANKNKFSYTGSTMGTTYSVKAWYGESLVEQAEIDRRLDEINALMSTYLPDSELSRFNRSEANQWFAVDDETLLVVDKALHYYEITGGASDVTVGPLVRLWDFGPGRHPIGSTLVAPAADRIASTITHIGAEKLETRDSPPSMRKSVDELEVDLSSIAKGYAVDAVAELLVQHGYLNFMVEIGGEVRAEGRREDEKPWRIGVERPAPNRREILKIVPLENKALATSGDYRNFRVFDGEKVSHIIDPQTGRPLPYRGWSVTVLADTCMEADALATALLVMGEDRGYDWCVVHNVAALFLIREDAEVREVRTPEFPILPALPQTL